MGVLLLRHLHAGHIRWSALHAESSEVSSTCNIEHIVVSGRVLKVHKVYRERHVLIWVTSVLHRLHNFQSLLSLSLSFVDLQSAFDIGQLSVFCAKNTLVKKTLNPPSSNGSSAERMTMPQSLTRGSAAPECFLKNAQLVARVKYVLVHEGEGMEGSGYTL